MIRNYLLDKPDVEYAHCEMFELAYIFAQINYRTESNFKLNNDEMKAEYNKSRKQLIKWFVECNTQDENENKKTTLE